MLVTKARYMPPWKPVHVGIDFANDRRLSDEESKLIANWVEADCPEGPAIKCHKHRSSLTVGHWASLI